MFQRDGKPQLMLITDRGAAARPLVEAVAAALVGGVTAVQLREPDLPARELLELARRLRVLTWKRDALLIVNDRLDVALAAQADGAHLGWRSLSVAEAGAVAGRRLRLGFSAHNLEEAQAAERDGADYITLSPVFPTPSKAGLVPVLGLEQFGEIARAVELPVIGLGGIDVGNAGDVMAAGARGVAVVRAILAGDDPAAAARDLAEAIA